MFAVFKYLKDFEAHESLSSYIQALEVEKNKNIAISMYSRNENNVKWFFLPLHACTKYV